MDILGLIPARGGSKGISQKNIVSLLGKPLLAYSCESASASNYLTRVILSTDNDAIAAVGRQYGVEVPFLRPATLAADNTPMIAVIEHALRALGEAENYTPDIIVLLQPTSPLRRVEHIDAAVELLLNTTTDTVVSVVAVPHQYSPFAVMRLENDGTLNPYLDQPQILRRQDKPVFYARNGPAILVTRRDVLTRGKLYGDIVRPLVMMESESIDLDTPEDLKLAEFWLDHRSKTVLLQSDPLQ